MLALALSVALMRQEEPPRLRTICHNGAAIVVERMPDEPMISVQLWASARSVPETPSTHGWRHLLEHLLARGSKGDLDKKLETNGSYLRARTFRDAMQIEICVGPRQLDLAISAITDILRPLQTDQATIDREIPILSEEFATYDDSSRLSAAAWTGAYADKGLDPFGSLATLAKATPPSLRDLQRKHFYPENLVLSIAGPIDIKQATAMANEAIGMKQGAVRVADVERPVGKPGRIETEGFGEGRAAIVAGYDMPLTAGALAFALAVASGVDGAFVTYTPSLQRGLVIVGQTEKPSGIGLKIDGLQDSEMPQLFALGRILAKNWMARYMRSASGVAYIRGLLLCQGHGSRPELMERAIDQLTFAQFKDAAQTFAKDKAVTVVGS
jgi:predicted Zn-dependent peptidase